MGRADDGHKSAGMSLVKVTVDSFEVKKEDAHPFCAYELTVTEGGKSHTLSRRWNDLKLMYEELHKEHKAELHAARDRVPKFEPHSWRLGGSHLDPDFLKQRQSRMEELLQALLDAFDISLAAESGPECVRTFLAANGRPSARRTVNALPKELAAELDAVADDDDAAAAAAADDASGENVVAEYFRLGEEPLFGIAYDGGFAMGSNLPLFAPGETDTGEASVTTSTGQVKTIPKNKATFGTLSSGGLY